jgi:aminopeptidase N
LTVKYKPYIDVSRIIGLLRQVQERQAKRPNGAQVAELVAQAVKDIEAAK